MILYISIFCTTDEGSCIAAETFGIKNIYWLVKKNNNVKYYTTQSFRTL